LAARVAEHRLADRRTAATARPAAAVEDPELSPAGQVAGSALLGALAVQLEHPARPIDEAAEVRHLGHRALGGETGDEAELGRVYVPDSCEAGLVEQRLLDGA